MSWLVDPAQLLRAARRAAGLSQTLLARAAGTSQSMVARYETGVVTPSVPVLARLLAAAGHELVLDSRTQATETEPGQLLASYDSTVRASWLPPPTSGQTTFACSGRWLAGRMTATPTWTSSSTFRYGSTGYCRCCS